VSTAIPPVPAFDFVPPVTVHDVIEQFPGIDAHRIRVTPSPGTATEEDVVRIHDQEDRLYELVDGTLIEKIYDYRASVIACVITMWLHEIVRPRRLGLISGAAGPMKFADGLVRIPDVAFASWLRFPDRNVPKEPVPALVPDLAVEVLSEGNSAAEMERKLKDYFRAGVRLVWIVDCDRRTVAVYTSPADPQVLDASATLTGGDVLPGFELPLAELFAQLDESGENAG
jgi:Uma2 family endonuclease